MLALYLFMIAESSTGDKVFITFSTFVPELALVYREDVVPQAYCTGELPVTLSTGVRVLPTLGRAE